MKPEEMERFKPKKSGKHDPPLVDDTVKKMLTRASFKSVEKRKVIKTERRPKSAGGEDSILGGT